MYQDKKAEKTFKELTDLIDNYDKDNSALKNGQKFGKL
mgnify:CR=1 FL=1